MAPTAPAALASMIDHTLLKLDAKAEEVDKLCDEAIEYKFKTVCVRLGFVERAALKLKGSGVEVCCVVGFHEGTASTNEKIREATEAVELGAREIDTVLNRGLLLADESACLMDLMGLREAIPSTTLKVILETSQLSPEHISCAVALALQARYDYVKTSTGFCGEGATVDNVHLMADQGEGRIKVKASGGIRTLEDAESMIEAGASRLGVSAGVAIVKEALARKDSGVHPSACQESPVDGY